ncbi:Nuclear hormone receptor [Dirofilaria immitis]
MVAMKISLEEFVALKAFVSWKGTICEISDGNKHAMKAMLDELCASLHQYYKQNNQNDLSERFGTIILLLSSIFAVGLQFVESHHEVAFFDLWQLDSLLIQLLKCEDDR